MSGLKEGVLDYRAYSKPNLLILCYKFSLSPLELGGDCSLWYSGKHEALQIEPGSSALLCPFPMGTPIC